MLLPFVITFFFWFVICIVLTAFLPFADLVTTLLCSCCFHTPRQAEEPLFGLPFPFCVIQDSHFVLFPFFLVYLVCCARDSDYISSLISPVFKSLQRSEGKDDLALFSACT
ncbi:hypothetical protein BJX96DRAFT_137902 [Aspergillus floccosus]